MKKRDQPNKRNVYSGMFLIALATLANEILLARVLSVASWYYLAYFAISLAMLGMTAGALVVYLVPERFRAETVFDSAAKAALTSAWTIAGSMLFTCLIPLLSSQGKSIMPVIGLITVSVICAIPYFFSGVAITSVLTRGGLPVGRMYAADLAGSASSCVLVLLGFTFADPYTLSLIAASVAALAAIYFSREGSSARFSKVSKFSLVALLFLAYGNGSAEFGLRPILVKGNRESVENFSYEKWNSFSRISVGGLERNRQYLWGGSPRTPGGLETDFFNMVIDGNAASWVRKFQSPHDIEALRYDVTNAAYHLGRQGTACIIGVGGGRDVQAAILFGHAKVVGVEVNPIFRDRKSVV